MSDDAALVERHIASKKRLKLVRLVGPLAIVVAVVFGIMSIADLVTSLDVEQLTASLSTEAERVMPSVRDRLTSSANDLKPTLQSQFGEAHRGLVVEIGKELQKQTEDLKDTLENSYTTRVAEGLATARERNRQELIEHFPSLRDRPDLQERVLNAADQGAQHWAKDMLAENMNQHLVALNEMRETLVTGFGTQDGEGGHPGANAEQAMMMYLELMADKMGASENNVIPQNEPPAEAEEGQ